MEIKKVGVVGCGLMGGGIAQTAAQAGFSVVVSEINDQLLAKGMSAIDKNLSKSVEKGKMTQDQKNATIGRIKGTINMNEFHDCDLVIEAAVENMALKKKIFADLDKICQKQAILATNTSCLSIIEIATATTRPTQIVGLHFFNPVPMMALMELVQTVATNSETIEAGKAFGKAMGKTVVLAKDTPGFIVNALLVPFLLDAIRMYDTGIASKEDIDSGVKLGLNHPMGPLALNDLVGLDTTMFIADAVYAETKDPRFIVPPLMRKMVTAGWLGRKTGKGFYQY